MVILTIFFDGQLWVGIFERSTQGQLETAKVIFGGEPSDLEVRNFVIQNYHTIRFSRPVEIDEATQYRKTNFKRMQREVRKLFASAGIGTKAQQAMKVEQSTRKVERKTKTRLAKEERSERAFLLRQEKKKEKKKGR